MNKNLQNIIKYTLSFAIAIVLLCLVFRSVNWESIVTELKNVSYTWVVVSMIVSLTAHWIRGLRWNLLLRPVGQSPSALNAFIAVMIGYMTNWVLPRLGEVARCSVLKKTDDVPIATSVGTVITERISDLLALIVLTGFTLILEYDQAMNLMNTFILSKLQMPDNKIFIAFILIGIILVGIAFLYLIYKFRFKLMQISIIGKVMTLLLNIMEGVLSVFKLQQKWLFIFYTFAMWLIYVITMYVLFFAMPGMENLAFNVAFVATIMSAISMIAPIQGGVGVYHLLVTASLVAYGVNNEKALAFATIANASQFLIMIITGAICTVAATFIEKRKSEPDVL
ncbi:MAG: lysylphosphatidylglycerol synthase transmembrane domain-containing protein [Bacteroidota bacterium]|nr:lysylphosphatidylglycerol synthase transmembrane domain-containing protein [Bacteroidota bacterium]